MCVPGLIRAATPGGLGTLGNIATGAGALSSAAGAFFATQGQRTALRAQAAVDEINAEQERSDARLAMQRGRTEQVNAKLRAGQAIGDIRNTAGAGNIVANEGTAAAQQASAELVSLGPEGAEPRRIGCPLRRLAAGEPEVARLVKPVAPA